MIQINIKDTEGNPIYLGDVVILYFPNPLIFIIGEVQFDAITQTINVYDGEKSHSMTLSTITKIERLGHITDRPKIKRDFGYIDLPSCTNADKYIQAIRDYFKV